uniref:Uncharacterized protein n=1 Tax=Podarcis muralis TaxID=64176 RepID=A0A670JVP9_PODMU
MALTCDLHNAVFRFHHQLLGCKMVDVQGHFPALGSLPDLRDAAAELAAQRPAVCWVGSWAGSGGSGGWAGGHWLWASAGQRADVARPAGGPRRPLVPVLRDEGHPKGLVKQAAAPVPVPEGIPAGAAQESEGDLAFCHGEASRSRPEPLCGAS